MTRDIAPRVKAVVIDLLGLDLTPETLDADRTFASFGADSLDMLEIVMSLEDEFGIRVSDDDLDGTETIQKVIDKVIILGAR